MRVFESNSENHPAALAALVDLVEKSVRGMVEKLGYHGKDRFVLFYYEPRGEVVVWRDSHSYGFSAGAGQIFFDELVPIADAHGVDLGSDGLKEKHVLLIDRAGGWAYFVERNEAIRFLASVAGGSRQTDFDMPQGVASLVSLSSKVEITQELKTELARQIWEKNGRLERRAMQDWLQAEAELWAERRAFQQSNRV